MSIAASGEQFVLQHASVLDNPTLKDQIMAKLQSIVDDVTGDADQDVNLFGDPLIRAKINSVLDDFWKNPQVDNAMVYSAFGDFFLEHHGVKGMKWGVRKQRGARAIAVSTKSSSSGKAKIKTKGGSHHDAHPDAIKVAESVQKIKRSGFHAVSNQELRDVANRINLEVQVKDLQKRRPTTRGKEFVRKQAKSPGTRKLATNLGKTAIGI
jgi:hypothetical protein